MLGIHTRDKGERLELGFGRGVERAGRDVESTEHGAEGDTGRSEKDVEHDADHDARGTAIGHAADGRPTAGCDIRRAAKRAASAAAIVLAAALLILPVSACSSTSSSSHSSYSSSYTTGTGSAGSTSSSQGTGTAAGSSSIAGTATGTTEQAEEEPPEGLADELPYKGLSEKWINYSWLGPAEKVDENSTYQNKRVTEYTWYSRNGKHESVFAAIAQDGQIVKVIKYLSGTNYWPTYFGLPDLTASGEPKPKPEPSKPDPLDYDSAEEYADNAEDWFESQGYDDPWKAAYHDWELNGPW